MKEFIFTALPFFVMSISIAFIAKNKRKNKKIDNYTPEGMCLGSCFDVLFGSMYLEYIGLFLSLGMLVGEVIGSLIKR